MIRLDIGGFPLPRREHRESYTEQVVAAAQTAASGTAASAAVAAVESAAGLWERGFMSAQSAVLKPWQLALAARSLLLRGESVWWASRAGLLPVSSHDVSGRSASPDRWQYRISLPAPAGTITKHRVAAGSIVHFRIGAAPSTPWRGCSPLVNAKATRGLLEQIEKSLTDEHVVPSARVVGVPEPESSQEVANQIAAGGGRVLLGEQAEAGIPGGGVNARSDWSPDRFGPEPETGSVTLRADVERSILAAAGVPSELVIPSSGGGDSREAWRRFLYSTIAPIGAIMSSELARIGLESEIHFDELRASDLAGRARAFKQLTEAGGLESGEIKRLTGFD